MSCNYFQSKIRNDEILYEISCEFLKPGVDPMGKAVAKGTKFSVFAKNVVMATGGSQQIPRGIFSQSLTKKVLRSDFCLTKGGLDELRRLLETAKRRNPNADSRVVLVGGSHSAFSVAWLCLNSLFKRSDDAASPPKPELDNKDAPSLVVGGKKCLREPWEFKANSIVMLRRSPIRVFYNSKRDANADNYTVEPGTANKLGQINTFGGLRGDAKKLYRSVVAGDENRVKLYKILDTAGGRAVVQKCYNDATVIVWCCGYKTNTIPVTSQVPRLAEIPPQSPRNKRSQPVPPATPTTSNRSSPLTINRPTSPTVVASTPSKVLMSYKYDGSQVDVDDQGRVLCADPMQADGSPLPNMYGIGLGWGLRANFSNGEKDGSSGRMDGYGVYLKRAASCVLGGIVGVNGRERVFGEENSNWDERMSAVVKKFGLKSPSAGAMAASGVADSFGAVPSSGFNTDKKLIKSNSSSNSSPKAAGMAAPISPPSERGSIIASRAVDVKPTTATSTITATTTTATAASSTAANNTTTKANTAPDPPVDETAQKKAMDRLSTRNPPRIKDNGTDKKDGKEKVRTNFMSEEDLMNSVNRLVGGGSKKKKSDQTEEGGSNNSTSKKKKSKKKSLKRTNEAAAAAVSEANGVLFSPPTVTKASSSASNVPEEECGQQPTENENENENDPPTDHNHSPPLDNGEVVPAAISTSEDEESDDSPSEGGSSSGSAEIISAKTLIVKNVWGDETLETEERDKSEEMKGGGKEEKAKLEKSGRAADGDTEKSENARVDGRPPPLDTAFATTTTTTSTALKATSPKGNLPPVFSPIKRPYNPNNYSASALTPKGAPLSCPSSPPFSSKSSGARTAPERGERLGFREGDFRQLAKVKAARKDNWMGRKGDSGSSFKEKKVLETRKIEVELFFGVSGSGRNAHVARRGGHNVKGRQHRFSLPRKKSCGAAVITGSGANGKPATSSRMFASTKNEAGGRDTTGSSFEMLVKERAWERDRVVKVSRLTAGAGRDKGGRALVGPFMSYQFGRRGGGSGGSKRR